MMALKNLIIYWLKLIKSAGAKIGINEIRSVQIYWWTTGFMLTFKSHNKTPAKGTQNLVNGTWKKNDVTN